MAPAHLALVLLVVVIWGLAFVATRWALDDFSPPQLTALRFLIAAAPALVLARPRAPGRVLIPIGLTLFMGQFLLQFFGIASGMPPGLASIVGQSQALFTILFAALALGECPRAREWTGTAVALAGLALIALTVGRDLTVAGLMLTGLSAVSWGVGNVLVKRLPPVDMLRLMVWLSVIPPLPSLALSVALDGPRALGTALAASSWRARRTILRRGADRARDPDLGELRHHFTREPAELLEHHRLGRAHADAHVDVLQAGEPGLEVFQIGHQVLRRPGKPRAGLRVVLNGGHPRRPPAPAA
jgi:O-acetylserine/cysteine efflux transporter